MSATNFTPIQLYRTSTAAAAPTAGNLAAGELAINLTDEKLFFKNAAGTVKVLATSGASTVGGSNTQVQFNNNGVLGGSANFVFDGTNVGIGIATPAARLEVVQNQAAFSYFDFYNTTASGGVVWRQVVRNIANSGNTSVDFVKFLSGGFALNNNDTNAANFTAFGVGASERMRIDSAGDVGIGTSAPVYQLQVRGLGQDTAALTDAGNKGGSLYLEATANAAGSGGALLFGSTFGNQTPFAAIKGLIVDGATNTIGDLAFSTRNAISDTALTERMRLTNAGNFGIGTAAPGDKLTIVDQNNAGFRFGEYNDTEGAVLRLASARGTIASPTALTADSSLFGVRGFGYSSAGTFGAAVAQINGRAAENFTGTAQGTYLQFFTTTTGTTTTLERMRIDGAGNVGIGTASPTQKLDVNGQTVTGNITVRGDGSEGGQISFNNAANSASPLNLDVDNLGNGRLFTSVNNANLSLGQLTGTGGIVTLNTAGSERMRISAAGDVGIGTASPAAKLDVNGSIYGASVTATGALAAFAAGGGVTSFYSGAVGTIRAFANSSGGASVLAFNASGSENMRIDSTGNVGIGTVSPGAKFQVVGSTTVGGYANVAAAFGAGVSSELYLGSLNGNNPYIGSGGAFPLSFNTNGAERMRITSAGFVGVGTTTPGAQFENVGQTRLGVNVTPGAPSSTDILSTAHTAMSGTGGNYLTIGQYPGAQGFAQWIQSSFTNPTTAVYNLILQPLGGNVGIGTSGPAAKLEVVHNQAAYSYFDFRNQTNGGGVVWRQIVRNIANTGDATVDFAKLIGSGFAINNGDTNAANFTAFGVGASERMRIDSSGNVGIGTSTPGYRLQVNSATESGAYITDGTRAISLINSAAAGGAVVGAFTNHPLLLTTNNTERARIDTSGNLLVGTTSSTGGIAGTAPRLVVEPPNTSTHGVILKSLGQSYDVGLIWNTAASGDNKFFEFGTDATYTARGSIDYNRAGGLVRYNTTSDYRAKDIIGPVQNSGATIDALKVYEGVMKGSTQSRPMLVAHEAQAHAPYAVSGVKDEVNADGTPKFQQMDVSSLIPLLLAEIQSLRARVAQLEGN